MELGLDHMRTGLRPGGSNLLEPGRKRIRSQIP